MITLIIDNREQNLYKLILECFKQVRKIKDALPEQRTETSMRDVAQQISR